VSVIVNPELAARPERNRRLTRSEVLAVFRDEQVFTVEDVSINITAIP
jgi:hypothetical protein